MRNALVLIGSSTSGLSLAYVGSASATMMRRVEVLMRGVICLLHLF